MQKTEEVTVTKKVTHTYCDDCGAEVKHSLACSRARCEFCKKELCDKCVAHERETMGDYREVYCKSCSDIFKNYERILRAAQKQVTGIWNTIYAECREARTDVVFARCQRCGSHQIVERGAWDSDENDGNVLCVYCEANKASEPHVMIVDLNGWYH